jgi:folate-binding protein YgfZ
MSAAVHPENGALFDLSARTKLRVSGSDRLRYINGQISNDLRKASAASAIHACVLTAKGKVNAEVFITSDGDSFLVDSDAEVREQLVARLERYVIADDVQIEDVTEQFAMFHLLRAEAVTLDEGRIVSATRYGTAGTDIWVGAEQRDAVMQRVRSLLPFCDSSAQETFRLELGIPRWGHELTEEIIPTEASLESSAIDYAKGCYIGQEVISRIKMSGQTNKRLCGLITTSDAPLRAGMRLSSVDADAKDVGWITSATMSARVGTQIALGYIKRGHQDIGTFLSATGEGLEAVRVEVAALPFV